MTKRFKQISALALALALCAAVLCVPVFAAPSIQPTSDFYVYDGANVLSDSTKNTIVSKNAALYEACGAQIVVATVNGSEGYTLEEYAYQIANAWGIGSSEKNNGVLLLMDIQNEDYQCIQGSGLENSLTTPTLSRILQEDLEPDFAVENYDAGALKTFNALYDEVTAIYKVSPNVGAAGTTNQTQNNDYNNGYGNRYDYGYTNGYEDEYSTGFDIFGLIVFLVIVVIAISAISSLSRPRRYGSSNSVLPFLLGLNCRPYRRGYHSNPFSYGTRPPQSGPPFNPGNFNGGFSGTGLFGGGHSGFGGGGSFGGGHGGGFSGGGGGFRGGGAGRGH